MKIYLTGILLSVSIVVSISAMEHSNNTILLNNFVSIGTFSAGDNRDGSVFLGDSLSLDWIPNGKYGLSYGIETGLLGGAEQDTIIFGIPIIFRFGWHYDFFKLENIDIFILGKAGWGFGIWGNNLDNDSTSGGIVGGIHIGGSFAVNRLIRIYSEIGYTYYGLARNSNYPEYPLGYGSGKAYASLGLSFKLL